MQNRFKIFVLIISFGLLVVNPFLVYAQQATNSSSLPAYDGGVDNSIKDYLCTPSEPADGHDLERCVNRLYRFSITAGAIIVVFFIVMAGYMYITGGETGKGKGKAILFNALTGFGILLCSYALLYFINPSLVVIKPIQPPIFTVGDIPTCKDIGFTNACGVYEGEDVTGEPSSTPGVEVNGVIKGGSLYNNFPRYAQCDPPWGSQRYGPAGAGTYCAAGCGPTAFAAIIQYFHKNKGATDTATPITIGDMAIRGGYRGATGGTNHFFLPAVAPKFGLKVQQVSVDQAITALEKGTPVHVSMDWKGGGFKSGVDGGHFMVAIAKKGDMVYMADSSKANITGVRVNVFKQFWNRGFSVTSSTWTPPNPSNVNVSGGAGSGGSSSVAVDLSLPSGMTEITESGYGVKLNIRYASSSNFTGTKLYKQSKCYLTNSAASKLKLAASAMKAKGKTLEIYDCYRPTAVQNLMVDWANGKAKWAAIQPSKSGSYYLGTYIAQTSGGKHPAGKAIDLTFSGASMTSDFDTFSSEAHYNSSNKDAKLLRDVMVGAGFTSLSTEWWHFSD